MSAPVWPCLTAGCERDEDCADALGGACGYYGTDEPDVPDEFAGDAGAYLADGSPLPEPPEDDAPPEPWDPQPIRVEEIPIEIPEEYRPVPLTADELAALNQRREDARRVHVVKHVGPYARLGDGFDPRGRHVGCDGEPAPAGGMTGGCGANPGEACRPPGSTSSRRRFVAGFTHPTRVAAERMLFGLDPA